MANKGVGCRLSLADIEQGRHRHSNKVPCTDWLGVEKTTKASVKMHGQGRKLPIERSHRVMGHIGHLFYSL